MPYLRNDCASITPENLPSAEVERGIGDISSLRVSITLRSVICSFQILIIVSLNARIYFCLASNDFCSLVLLMRTKLRTEQHQKKDKELTHKGFVIIQKILKTSKLYRVCARYFVFLFPKSILYGANNSILHEGFNCIGIYLSHAVPIHSHWMVLCWMEKKQSP